MNPSTGHLIGMGGETTRKVFGEPVTYEEIRNKGYEPVPSELDRAAAAKLAGKEEAMVSLTSGGKLSRWAAGKRKKNRIAKESRRKNRGR